MRTPRDWRVYLVTDSNETGGRPLVDVLAQALAGGIGAVQVRERGLPAGELLALALQLRELTLRYDAALLINDRIDVALACGADGVHLPASSFSIADARALMGANRLVGVSAHSVADVIAANAAGADFLVFGPVYETPSKRSYGPPAGLANLREAARASELPVLAIGGITPSRVSEVLQAGAAGVALIRAILGAADPEVAARQLVAAR